MAKHFVNDPARLVDDAIDGLLRGASGVGLARLDAPEGIRVVLRDPLPANQVAIVSGGGSGHEPAHAGFVGEGMLSAAICGDVFASPPVEAVLAGIRAVTGPEGCLLIVKNYTGDRLNFGLAAERAQAEGLRVEMVVVSDDVAIEESPQPRGIAGTLLVHKVAGAAAAEGRRLDEVAAIARRTAGAIRSIGLSLTGCIIPGANAGDRIGAEAAEIGLGIHGEPGAETIALGMAEDMVARLTERLVPHLPPEGEIALLINTLGGVPPIQENVLASAVLRGPLGARTGLVIGPAPMMTALDMRGVSLTVLPLDAQLSAAIRAPAAPRAWVPARSMRPPRLIAVPLTPDVASPAPSDDAATRDLILSACGAIQAMSGALDALDAKVGDGDTGATFAAGARELAGRMGTLPLAEPADLFQAIGRVLGERAGGSSGVLLSILFSAAGAAAAEGVSPPAALRDGLERMKEIGGARPGDRTMIDALEPALDAIASGKPLHTAAIAARQGADATAAMHRAKAGRSAHVPKENLAGVNDPGAEGVAQLFEYLAAAYGRSTSGSQNSEH